MNKNPSFQKLPKSCSRAGGILIAFAALVMVQTSEGAEKHWNPQGGSTDFNLSGTPASSNWVTTTGGSTRTALPGASDVASFTTAGYVNPNLTSSITIQRLNGNQTGYTLSANPGAVLNLSNAFTGASNSSAVLLTNTNSTDRAWTISAPINLTAASGTQQMFYSNGTSSTILVSGVISSTNSPMVRFQGGWNLTGDNTYTGDTMLGNNPASRDAVVVVGNSNAFSSGTVIISGVGSTALTAGTSLTGANRLENNFVLQQNLTLNTATSSFEFGGTFDQGTDATATTQSIALNNTGNATFGTGAGFRFELGAPGTNDVLNFTGLTDASLINFSDNVVDFVDLGGLTEGTYTLFTFDGTTQLTNYTGNLVVGSGLGGFSGSFIYNENSIQLMVVPEPSTLVISMLGLGALAYGRRSRRGRCLR